MHQILLSSICLKLIQYDWGEGGRRNTVVSFLKLPSFSICHVIEYDVFEEEGIDHPIHVPNNSLIKELEFNLKHKLTVGRGKLNEKKQLKQVCESFFQQLTQPDADDLIDSLSLSFLIFRFSFFITTLIRGKKSFFLDLLFFVFIFPVLYLIFLVSWGGHEERKAGAVVPSIFFFISLFISF